MSTSSNPHLICYLDILGYESLVRDPKNAEIAVKSIEAALSILSSERLPAGNAKKIFDSFNVHLMSDSLIIALPIYEAAKLYPEEYSAPAFIITMFFGLVSTVTLVLTAHLKYFIRGAITIGEFYQKSIIKPENQFIFSPGLVSAYKLQQQCNVPRILIDNEVIRLYRKICEDRGSHINKMAPLHVERDTDGYYFLDIYKSLVEETMQIALGEIVEAFNLQIQAHKDDASILGKYYWFHVYHNRKIAALNLSIKDTGKFILKMDEFLK